MLGNDLAYMEDLFSWFRLRLKLLIFLLNLCLRLVLIRSLIIAGNLIVG